jgi:hypothetical protein
MDVEWTLITTIDNVAISSCNDTTIVMADDYNDMKVATV